MSSKPKLSVDVELLARIATSLGKVADAGLRRAAIRELRAILRGTEYPKVRIVKAHTNTCACVVGDSGVCDCGAVVDGVAVGVDVRKILLDVVPGADGEGHEVYAKSVADVEAVLSKQGGCIEELESVVANLIADQHRSRPVGYVSPAGLAGARSGKTAMFRSSVVGVYTIPLFAAPRPGQLPRRKTAEDYKGYVEPFQAEAAALYNEALDDVAKLWT